MYKLITSSISTARNMSLLLVALLGALLLVACGDNNLSITPAALTPLAPSPTPVPASPLPNYSPSAFGATQLNVTLIGGGSTRLEPVFKNWLGEYKKIAPNVTINFQTTNSGTGQAAFLGTPVPKGSYTFNPTSPLDFGGSDFTYNGAQLVQASSKGEVVHLPIMLGAVVVSYRLDGFSGELHMSGPTIANIFLGNIKSWDDPAITNDNGGRALPKKPIIVIIRPRDMAGSGTSELFSRYMALINTDMRDKVGVGSQLNWPRFGQVERPTGADVATAISQTDGGFGYVDQEQADAVKLNYVSIRNQSGRYIRPTVESVTAAAQGVLIPDDFRTFVVNPEGENAYPIAGFTWIMVWKDLKNMPNASRDKALALVNLAWWGLHDGQKFLPSNFSPLPASLIPRLEARFVNSDPSKVFQFNGQPLLTAPK